MQKEIRYAFFKKNIDISKEYHNSNDLHDALNRKDNLISRFNNIILMLCPLQANLTNLFIILISEFYIYNYYQKILIYQYLFTIIFANTILIILTNFVILYFYNTKQLKYINFEYQREKWEIDNNLQGEINEMLQIYIQKHNISSEHAHLIVNTLIQYPKVFLDTMFFEELGLLPPDNRISFKKDFLFSNQIIFLISFLLVTPYLLDYLIFNFNYSLLFMSIINFILNLSLINYIIKKLNN